MIFLPLLTAFASVLMFRNIQQNMKLKKIIPNVIETAKIALRLFVLELLLDSATRKMENLLAYS